MVEADSEDGLVALGSRPEISRREALKWLASGLAAASGACAKAPGDPILPYVELPDGVKPGAPQRYATSFVLDGYASGLLATTREGRPIKLDGNPRHPASLGAATPTQQASLLDLYDPHRAKSVRCRGLPASLARVAPELAARRAGPVWLVLPAQSSPTIRALIERVRERQRELHVVYAHADPTHNYAGAAIAFGRALEQQLELEQAEVVVCVDADVLGATPLALHAARGFAARRRPDPATPSMSRWYVAEPTLTPTGSIADTRLAARAGDGVALLCALALALRGRRTLPELPWAAIEAHAHRLREEARGWTQLAARDLMGHAGAGAIAVGARQPAAAHALAHVLNAALGNLGHTVTLREAVRFDAGAGSSLRDFANALRSKQVNAALLFEVNPVYASGLGRELGELLAAAPFSLHYTPYENETSHACAWTVPASHYLESWGDARAPDGTASFIQPVVRPLYGTPSLIEILDLMAGGQASARELVRAQWREALGGDEHAETAFAEALRTGLVEGSASPVLTPPLSLTASFAGELGRAFDDAKHGLELALCCSPHVHDGRFANNGWLQELPHAATKQTWGNAALLSPRTAQRLGVHDEQRVRLRLDGKAIEVPALIAPHQADESVTLELGYGRTSRSEPIADRVGANGFALMPSAGGFLHAGLGLEPTSRRERLARTQDHLDQHGRELARAQTLAELRSGPPFARSHEPASLLEERPALGLQWAMTIDLTLCTGCSSCVVACQAENNVPVVGADGVRRGREMHWLRIDTYLAPEPQGAQVVHQPMLCQHCEHAPCEYVCPVFATQHSPDGLNEMVYNRCIGTRFCSNNCPYKVRRFNWFHYTADAGSLALQRNPEVTVRERGVMEKCTYCVQRIRAAEISARMERRAIRPGEVVTACQEACPTSAIQFAALQHRDSAMVRWRQEPRAYAVLDELGTRPRTLYLAKVTNAPTASVPAGGADE